MNRLFDTSLINPRLHSRYSPNLYKWLTFGPGKNLVHVLGVFRDSKGTLWIGHHDGDFPRELIGARLNGVLCNGSREQTAAWQRLDLTEIEDFWVRYVAVGRCAVDVSHSISFVGNDQRWATNGDKRLCLWCGNTSQTLKRWTEAVEKTEWVTA